MFIAFLVIGLARPVLPLHVHQDLGLGTFVIGLVAGAQFAASLFSRFWAGNYADSRGAKHALVTGLLVAAAAGLLYFLSTVTQNGPYRPFSFSFDGPKTSVTILLLDRAVLGGAESFIVTGAFTWGLALVGPQYGPDYGLGRDGDVRRLRGDRARPDADSAVHPAAHPTAPAQSRSCPMSARISPG